jgi:aspartate/methionine/tyrosine aminotransferase
MALNGTREGLFNAALALIPEAKGGKRPAVLIPNPFYQVYAVGALAAGAEPVYVPATEATGFLPDYAALPAEVLDRAVAAFVCSPANPQGVVAPEGYLADLLDLAERHDFRVFSDECYAELWRHAPPPGILAVAAARGADPERALAFHSLSKRSNLPGLRSGFVAGGPRAIAAIRRLRAYAGAPLPEPLQAVAAAVWADEAHVVENRALYARKYALADRILGNLPGYRAPEAGFFLWLPVPDGEAAALKLWRETGVRVLPGAYLARAVDGVNPGAGHIRVALVAPEDETRGGLERLAACLSA